MKRITDLVALCAFLFSLALLAGAWPAELTF